MDPERFLLHTIMPAAEWLGPVMGRRMDEPQRLVLALAIAIEETSLDHRRQVLKGGRYGKGRSWWQNEGGSQASIGRLMNHPTLSRPLKQLCIEQTIPWDLASIYEAVAWHDLLAAVIALLLIFSDAQPVPDVTDEYGMWGYYWRCWQPGAYRNWKPGDPQGERWHDAHRRALNAVTLVSATPEQFTGATMNAATLSPAEQDLIARFRTGAANANAPVTSAVSAKELAAQAAQAEAAAARTMTVSTPDGRSVTIDPPQTKATLKRGSSAWVILGLLPALAEVGQSVLQPAAAAVQQRDWVALAGIAFSALIAWSQRQNDNIQFRAMATVAQAQLDPVGQTAPKLLSEPLISSQLGTLNDPQMTANNELLAKVLGALERQGGAA